MSYPASDAQLERASRKRFTGELPSAFGLLTPYDSLTARIERIWNLKPTVIEVCIGYIHPHDDSLRDWTPPIPMGRKAAADALRAARRQRLKIERSTTGYEISGVVHPAWEYDR